MQINEKKEAEINRLHKQERESIMKFTIVGMICIYLIRVMTLIIGSDDFKIFGIAGIVGIMIEYYFLMFRNYQIFEQKRNQILNTDKIKK